MFLSIMLAMGPLIVALTPMILVLVSTRDV